MMDAAMTDTEWLVAVTQIMQLKARRVRALDTKDWGTYEQLHADDHVSHNEGEPQYDNKTNVARLRQQLHAGIITVHHVHTPDIQFESPESATGIWAMEDMLYWQQGGAEHWLHGFGFYHERYVRRGGEWKFVSRQLRRLKVLMSPGGSMADADR